MNCPEWYVKHCSNLNNWLKGKNSYLIEWKNTAGEHFLTQQYAENETDAIFKAGQAKGPGSCIEFVGITKEN